MTNFDRKTAYQAAAEACRWAAAEGWGACEGQMIDRNCYGEVSVCVLGAMALRRALNERIDDDFAVIYDDILHGSMAEALGMGTLDDAWDMSCRFEDFVADWLWSRDYGEAKGVWRQAAAMFDGLASN